MRVFAISDLHLSGQEPKPMDIFGQGWERHWDKIRADWMKRVEPDDCILIGGDISWAMHMADAKVDLDEIGALPGHKVLIRGNHDYWWSSLTKIRALLLPGTYALQNDCIRLGSLVVAGSRGWMCPGSGSYSQDDEKLYLREAQRLEFSLKSAQKVVGQGDTLIAMMHFAPFNERQESSLFTDLLEKYKVQMVTYGHLHGYHLRNVFEGVLRGVEYRMVSCDYLQFRLTELLVLPSMGMDDERT